MHRIKIHDFGPIKETDVIVKDFTILTGPQASGKSTIAKLIFFCRTVKNDILTQLIMPNGEDIYELPLCKGIEKRLRRKFLKMFGTTWTIPMEMEVFYQYKDNVSLRLFLEKDRNDDKKNFVKFEFSQEANRYITNLDENIDYNGEQIVLLKSRLGELFDDRYEGIYIPAGRGMITLLTDQLNYVFSSDELVSSTVDYCTKMYVEQILKLRPSLGDGLIGLFNNILHNTQNRIDRNMAIRMLDYINSIIKGQYFYSYGEEKLRINPERYIKINYASSGQQESIWILNLIFYYMINNKNIFMIIEEPEAHLYPEAQHIISKVISIFASCDNDVLVTTHSPYILGAFNNMLYASKLSDVERRDEIVGKDSVLPISNTNALYLDGGCAHDAMYDGLIKNELIDDASETINDEMDRLIEIFWREKDGKVE